TTLSHAGLRNTSHAGEAGGLSGKPLFEKSTIVLAKMRKRVGESLPIIGVGGVSSAATAAEKIRAGANLVQLYSCMIYAGPTLPGEIVNGLSRLCDREQIASISALRSTRTAHWADRPL
ncbi:MAG: quinone-dependent dihydroorotate dehydrogenase, partial [Shinella sp.]